MVNWIIVDVPNQVQEISFFINQNPLEVPLEEISGSTFLSVDCLCVAVEEIRKGLGNRAACVRRAKTLQVFKTCMVYYASSSINGFQTLSGEAGVSRLTINNAESENSTDGIAI